MADPLLGFNLAQQGINLSSPSTSSSGTATPSPKQVYQVKEKLLRPALTSHFQCWFIPPTPVVNWLNERELSYNLNQELISLSCSEASLPGSSLLTNEINNDYTGVTERHAYRRAYDDRADFTFYVDHGRRDGNYNLIWFFENWISYISNEQYVEGLEQPNFNYRVNFPDTYQSNAIYINKFERDYSGQYLQYRFLRAYPISINSMPIAYESSELLKCTVSITYTRYVIKRLNSTITQGAFENALNSGISPSYGSSVGPLSQELISSTNKSSGGSVEIKSPTSTPSLQQQILTRRRGF